MELHKDLMLFSYCFIPHIHVAVYQVKKTFHLRIIIDNTISDWWLMIKIAVKLQSSWIIEIYGGWKIIDF